MAGSIATILAGSLASNGTVVDVAIAGNTTIAGLASGHPSPTTRLFNTLLVTFAAIGLGALSVRFRFLEPENGDTRALGFYTGKIALPLLIFSTTVTADLSSVNLGTIAACTMGKLVVMLLTWLVTFFSYKAKRPRGQQVLTSTVFAFFTVASNDFAIGFPVIEAISGRSMAVYIAANAVIMSLIFYPLTMVLFAIGGSMLSQEEGGGGANGARGRALRFLTVLKDIFTSPVITCTILGLAYRGLLGHTLRHDGDSLRLPEPLGGAVELFTSPFVMSALFLTGTTLRFDKIEVWPIALCLMKVVVCACVSFFFGDLLVGHVSPEARSSLVSFTFFYGSLPAGAAPLVFASQYDSGAEGTVSTATVLAMLLASPIMFVTALFLQQESGALMTGTLSVVQLGMSIASLACGAAFAALLIALRCDWGLRSPCKLLLGAYGCVAMLYEIVICLFDPMVVPGLCRDYAASPWSPSGLLASFLQNNCRCLLLVLQGISVFAPSRSEQAPAKGAAMVAACFLAALAPTLTSGPNTLDQVCELGRALLGMRGRLAAMLAWSAGFLLASLVMASWGIRRAFLCTCGAVPAGTEAAAEEASAETEDSRSKQELTAAADDELSPWIREVPRSLIMPVTVLMVLRLLMQVVNTTSVLTSPRRGGSLEVMLILESILTHGQVAFLVLVALHNESLTSHLLAKIPRRLSFLQRRKAGQEDLELGDEEEMSGEWAPSVLVPDTMLGVVRVSSLPASCTGSPRRVASLQHVGGRVQRTASLQQSVAVRHMVTEP